MFLLHYAAFICILLKHITQKKLAQTATERPKGENMKKLLCAFITVIACAASIHASACDRGRPYIHNNTLVTDQGTRMRGSTFWLYGWMYNKVQFAQSETAWNAFHSNRLNAVRLACAYRPDHSNNLSLDEYEVLLDDLIDRAAEAGIYVLLEYHYYPGNYSMSGATDFWNRFAPRYADRTHVIYELTNEPVSWAPKDFEDHHLRDFEELWRICNNNAPETPIVILSFANVGYDGATPRQVADRLQGINWNKTLVGFHTYWRESSERMQNLKDGYPVVCTEFMHCEWHETKPLDGVCQHSVRLEQLEISWWQWEIMETESEMNSAMPDMVQGNKDAGTWWEADDYESCGEPRDTTAPTITTQPQAKSAEEGQNVAFSAGAEGWPLTYQWKRDGAAIDGATEPTYTIETVSLDDNGASFSVTISNAKGSVTSDAATLEVTPYQGVSMLTTPQAPVIDGVKEALWDGATNQALLKVAKGEKSNDADLSAAFTALWDSDALYFYIAIADDSKNIDSEAAYNDDGIELFIDATNGKSSSYTATDFQFRFLRGSTSVSEKNEKTNGVVCAMDDQASGYRCEVSIPWSTLGVTPQASEFIGIDVHVNDDDDGGDRDCKIAWEDETDVAWQDPSVFKTVRLSSNAVEPVSTGAVAPRKPAPMAVVENGRVLKLACPVGCKAALYEISGKKLATVSTKHAGEMRLDQFPRGMYIIRITGKKLNFVRKIAVGR